MLMYLLLLLLRRRRWCLHHRRSGRRRSSTQSWLGWSKCPLDTNARLLVLLHHWRRWSTTDSIRLHHHTLLLRLRRHLRSEAATRLLLLRLRLLHHWRRSMYTVSRYLCHIHTYSRAHSSCREGGMVTRVISMLLFRLLFSHVRSAAWIQNRTAKSFPRKVFARLQTHARTGSAVCIVFIERAHT